MSATWRGTALGRGGVDDGRRRVRRWAAGMLGQDARPRTRAPRGGAGQDTEAPPRCVACSPPPRQPRRACERAHTRGAWARARVLQATVILFLSDVELGGQTVFPSFAADGQPSNLDLVLELEGGEEAVRSPARSLFHKLTVRKLKRKVRAARGHPGGGRGACARAGGSGRAEAGEGGRSGRVQSRPGAAPFSLLSLVARASAPFPRPRGACPPRGSWPPPRPPPHSAALRIPHP